MDWIVIDGLNPYDGRYELDPDHDLTQREWGWVKRYAGYASPLDMGEHAFADPEMIGVLAIVALRRNGKIETREVPDMWERLQDAPFGATVKLEGGKVEEESDAGSPPSGSSDAKLSSNGVNSLTGSASLADPLKPTGSPASATSASAPATSVT